MADGNHAALLLSGARPGARRRSQMFLNTVLKVYVPTQVFLTRQVKLFAQRTDGASGIEYALIAGMVAVAIVTFVAPIKSEVVAIFTSIKTALTAAAT